MSANPSTLEIWLKFIADIAWPVAILSAVIIFRSQFKSLLARILSLKKGDVEIAFQPPSPDPKPETPVRKADVIHYGTESALPESAIRDVVKRTGELGADDEINWTTKIFLTPRQATWLVFSKKMIFCVLDDDTTRGSGRLVQWSLAKERAESIKARIARPGVGLLDIGPRRNWLYSPHLFPTPDALVDEVQFAIREA